jgi:glutathione peroxidase-family protein
MLKLSDFRPAIYYLIRLTNGTELEAVFITSYYDRRLAFQIYENDEFKVVEFPCNQIQSYDEIGDFEHYCEWKGWDKEYQNLTFELKLKENF